MKFTNFLDRNRGHFTRLSPRLPSSGTFRLLTCALLLLTAAQSHAAIMLTVNATVQNDNFVGLYTAGESVSFSFYLNPAYDESNSNAFYNSGSSIYWDTDTGSHSSILSDVTGSKLTGSWVGASDPYDFVQVNYGTTDTIDVSTDADAGSTGLQANGLDVLLIDFTATYSGLDFSDPGSLVSPSFYLADYVGTYSIDSQSLAFLETTVGQINFNITSLEISAVPEPATTGLVAGLGVAIFALLRKRKRT